jgi:hypothetical protein
MSLVTVRRTELPHWDISLTYQKPLTGTPY